MSLSAIHHWYDSCVSSSIMRSLATTGLLVLCVLAVGGVASAQTDRDAAEAPFDKTTTIDELFEKARGAFGLERLDLAAAFYREILIREPTHLTAMLELANVYERNGQFEYARGLLIRAATQEPQNANIIERREAVDRVLAIALDDEINVMMADGEYEKAIPKIALRINIGPETDDLYFRRAQCLLESNQFDAAIKDLETAIRLDPQERYYELRARILTQGTRREAQALLEQSRRASRAGDREAALELLGQVLELDPENARAHAEFIRLSQGGAMETPAPEGSRSRWVPDLSGIGRGLMAVARFFEQWFGLMLTILGLWIVFRSPLARLLLRRFSQLPLLSGQLDHFSLQEVMLMLNSEAQTGQLRVRASGCHGTVWFDAGEPRHCEVGKMKGSEAVIHLIDEAHAGTFIFVEGAMPRKRTVDMPLSMILVEQARAASPDEKGPAPKASRRSRMKELLENR